MKIAITTPISGCLSRMDVILMVHCGHNETTATYEYQNIYQTHTNGDENSHNNAYQWLFESYGCYSDGSLGTIIVKNDCRFSSPIHGRNEGHTHTHTHTHTRIYIHTPYVPVNRRNEGGNTTADGDDEADGRKNLLHYQ